MGTWFQNFKLLLANCRCVVRFDDIFSSINARHNRLNIDISIKGPSIDVDIVIHKFHNPEIYNVRMSINCGFHYINIDVGFELTKSFAASQLNDFFNSKV